MVKEVCGRGGARMGAAYQSLPTRATKPKTPGFLHVSSPTNAYRILCPRSETLRQIRIGLPTLTNGPIWLCHRYRIVLPIITSRGVKYTHDINCTVLHSNRGPLGLCGISQASDPKKVVRPHPHGPESILGPGPAVLTPRPRHPGRTVYILTPKHSILVKNS